MEAAPALHLSEEAQDLILDFVRGCEPAAGARGTFHAFCLVSRRWLSSGRRALYYEPLAIRPTDWKVAEALRQSVEGNAVLGASVRNLGGLEAVSRQLHKRRHDVVGGRAMKGRSGWQWGSQLVAACPNLKSVGVHLSSSKYALAIAQQLSPRITSLTLQSPREMDFSPEEFSHWLDTAKGSMDNVVQLSVINFHWPTGITQLKRDEEPRFPHPIQSLSFDECDLCLSDLFAFVPSTPTHLRHLSLRTHMALSPADCVLLISAVGPSLESLSFTSLWAARPTRIILPDEYAEVDGHCLPISFFSPLPKLKHLELTYTTGMSLPKLEALAFGSPNLESLSFHRSTWQLDSPPFDLTPTVAFLLAQPQLEAIFGSEHFNTLKSLNLGLLPLVKGTRWKGLKEISDSKGVQLILEGCRDPSRFERCTGCGELHESGAGDEWF